MKTISILEHLQSGAITQSSLEKDVKTFLKESVKIFSKKWGLLPISLKKESEWVDSQQLEHYITINWEKCELSNFHFSINDVDIDSLPINDKDWFKDEYYEDYLNNIPNLGIDNPKAFIKELAKLNHSLYYWVETIFNDERGFSLKIK